MGLKEVSGYRPFYFLNLFLNNLLVYCRIFKLIILLSNICWLFRCRHWIIEKIQILKIIHSKWTIYEDFKDWIWTFTLLKRLTCLKWILKHSSTILHSQFNHHTLPVTSFNSFCRQPYTIYIFIVLKALKAKHLPFSIQHGIIKNPVLLFTF